MDIISVSFDKRMPHWYSDTLVNSEFILMNDFI